MYSVSAKSHQHYHLSGLLCPLKISPVFKDFLHATPGKFLFHAVSFFPGPPLLPTPPGSAPKPGYFLDDLMHSRNQRPRFPEEGGLVLP